MMVEGKKLNKMKKKPLEIMPMLLVVIIVLKISLQTFIQLQYGPFLVADAISVARKEEQAPILYNQSYDFVQGGRVISKRGLPWYRVVASEMIGKKNTRDTYINIPNVDVILKDIESIWNKYVNVKTPKPVDVTRFVYNELLLYSVHKLGMYDKDQKLFVDRPTKVSLETYKKNMLELFKTVEKDVQNRLYKNDLKKFIEDHFVDGKSPEIQVVEDDVTQQPLIDINWNSCKECTENNYELLYNKLIETWDDLIRKVETKCTNTGIKGTCVTTQLDVGNHIFAVPGGRFTELYYWDSLLLQMGLLLSGRKNVAESTLRVFKKWVDEHGHVPNGGRTYYLNRSQPPVLAIMVKFYLEFDLERDNVDSHNKLNNSSANKNIYDNHKKTIRTIAEFGTTLLKERSDYWDSQRYSLASKCEEKLREELEKLFTSRANNNSVPNSSTPYKELNDLTNIYSPEKINDEFIKLSCSGYHYGPNLQVSNNENDNSVFRKENPYGIVNDKDGKYEEWLRDKLKNFLPRIESYGHDYDVAEKFVERSEASKSNYLTGSVKSPELRKKLIMQTLANYAESGWDFSSRWLSQEILEKGYSTEDFFVKITSPNDYLFDNSVQYSKMVSNTNSLLSNLETAIIFPIDLNAIILENTRIISSFLKYFNRHICSNDSYYKQKIIIKKNFKKLLEKEGSTTKESELIKNAETLCQNIEDKIVKYDKKYAGLRNFIALMLWDPVNKHFGDYNERHSKIGPLTSAAEAFAYLLDTGDIHRRNNKFDEIASLAQQRIYDKYRSFPIQAKKPIKDFIFNPISIKAIFPDFDYSNVSTIYANAHKKLAQFYREHLNNLSPDKNKLYPDEIYEDYLNMVNTVFLETEDGLKDFFKNTENSPDTNLKLEIYENNWTSSEDPTFDGVITINELIQISGIVYSDYYEPFSYKNLATENYKQAPTFYDLYSSRISFNDYISSYMNLVYKLTSYNSDSSINNRILMPVPVTPVQTVMQWDFPNNWAPLEYAITFSLLNLIKYKNIVDYTCSILSESSMIDHIDNVNLHTNILLYQNKGSNINDSSNMDNELSSLTRTLNSCNEKTKSLLSLLSYSNFIKRLSNYVKLVSSGSKFISSSPNDKIKFFEKYNVASVSSGSGGEYANQVGFGWTNGYMQVALYNIANYYSQISQSISA